MNRLAKLTVTELKLFMRDPIAWFFAIAFPPLLLVILGSIPAFREPSEDLGGLRVIDLYVPIMVGFVLAMLACPPTWPPTGRRASCAGCPPPRCTRPGCSGPRWRWRC